MDPSDGSTRMNDITATYKMDITQTGSQIQIVFYTYPTSYKTDAAYWNEYGMVGVPPVSGGDICLGELFQEQALAPTNTHQAH